MIFSDYALLRKEKVSPKEVDPSTKYIGLEHIGEGTLSLNGYGFASDINSSKAVFEKGDILFGKLRPYFRKVIIAPFDGICSTDIWVVKPKNGIDRNFLFYWMASQDFVDEVTRSSEGTRMPRAKWEVAIQIEIPDVTVIKQQKIGEILYTFDQKIQLNQQTNKTLEAMAQAIFKSWFVDFEPVRAKIRAKEEGRDANRAAMTAIAGVDLEQDWDEIEAALDQKLSRMSKTQRQQLHQTAELFPDELVDSELGEVPKGWGVTSAEKVLKRFKVPKRIKKDEVEETGKSVVLEQGEGIIMGYHNGEAGFDASPDNPYFIFGDHTCITHLTIEPFDVAPNVIPLQGEEFNSYWTYYAVKDLQQFQEYRRHWSELKVKVLITPNNDVDQVFADAIKPLIMQINKNRNQNLTLSQLRDTLLPKLISGEVGL